MESVPDQQVDPPDDWGIDCRICGSTFEELRVCSECRAQMCAECLGRHAARAHLDAVADAFTWDVITPQTVAADAADARLHRKRGQ